MVVPSEVGALSGVLHLCSSPWKSRELCSSSSARAAPPSELNRLCQSHLAGQERSVPHGSRSCSVPCHTLTPVKQELPRSCSPGIIQTSLGFIPLPAAAVAAFIVLNSLTSQQGHLPDSAHFYISFASHILPHGCFTAL